MSEGIVQKLGFNCDDAIRALTNMDDKMAAVEGRFRSLASAMTSWNSSATPTIDTFKNIASAAGNAASAMNRYNAAMSKAGSGSFKMPEPPKEGLWLPPGVAEELKKVGAAGTDAGDKVKDGATKAGNALDGAKGKAGGFCISLQMLSRIVITQTIVRAISGIRDALSEAITANIDFTKRMSELQSIMEAPKSAMDGLKSSVAELAREFNFPIAQVAEAEYQTVSAQFVSTADRANVMTASMKLAKVGCMELSTAVSLITSALNSYHMASGQADDVAGKFFQTIKDGKVRGEEISASLGKVMPVAAELGVGIPEVTTAIVQLTTAGVKAPEAATSLRSALMALIKPSKDLEKEMHDLGYASGEQMIAGNGLVGTLNLLRESSDKTIASCVKLIPNVRAQNTVLRETGENAGNAAKELQKMRAAGAESLNQAYKVFIDTNAEKVTADLNKLKVWLTTDLGQSLLDSVAKLMAFTGGITTLTSAINALTTVGGPAVIALLSYVGATKLIGASAAISAAFLTEETVATAANTVALTVNEQRALSVAMAHKAVASAVGVLGGVITAGVGAWAIFQYAIEKVRGELVAARDEFIKTEDEIRKRKDTAARKAINAEFDADKELSAAAIQKVALINKAHNRELENARDANAEQLDEMKSALGAQLSVKERQFHIMKDVVREAEQEIQSSLKRTAKLTAELDDSHFNFETKMKYKDNPRAEQQQYEQRANDFIKSSQKYYQVNEFEERLRKNIELTNQTMPGNPWTAQLLKQADFKKASPEDFANASADLNRAESYAKMAMSAAQASGSVNAMREAQQVIENIAKSRLALEKEIRAVEKERADAAAAVAAKEKASSDVMRKAMKEYLKESDLFNKHSGNPLTDKERQAHGIKAEEAYKTFTDEALKDGSNIDLGALLNFASLRDKLHDAVKEGITDIQVKTLKLAPGARADLIKQIQGTEGQLQLLQQFTSEDLSQIDPEDRVNHVMKTLADAPQKAKDWKDLGADQTDNTNAIQEYSDVIDRTIKVGAIPKEERLRKLAQWGTDREKMPTESEEHYQQTSAKPNNQKLAEIQGDASWLGHHPEQITAEVIKKMGEKFGSVNKDVAYSGDYKRTKDVIDYLQKISDYVDSNTDSRIKSNADGAEEKAMKGVQDLKKIPQRVYTSKQDYAEEMGKGRQLLGVENGKLPKLVPDDEKATTFMLRLNEKAKELHASLDEDTAAAGRLTDAITGVNRALEEKAGMKQASEQDLADKRAAAQNQASGGTMWSFLAGGGQPRGTDTIPAMLSPHEMVINERSARKFGSQLQAMNAGGQPNYHSHGGSVTNVGDISVHLSTGGSVGAGTGRQIAQELRRELRRGSSSLS